MFSDFMKKDNNYIFISSYFISIFSLEKATVFFLAFPCLPLRHGGVLNLKHFLFQKHLVPLDSKNQNSHRLDQNRKEQSTLQ